MNSTSLFKALLLAFMLVGASSVAYAQQKTISGKVSDSNGDPVMGAVVMAVVGGSTQGQTTDIDGMYTISIPSSVKTLTFSLLGYDDVIETVGNRTEINVTLKESSLYLEEAVSIGYAKVKRKDLTGSSVSVSGNDLAQVPATTAAQALSGKAAGLSIVSQSGAPGADLNITIRGGSSITQST